MPGSFHGAKPDDWGAGALRPLRDLGRRRADGQAALDAARLWVAGGPVPVPVLGPGERAGVRLAPLEVRTTAVAAANRPRTLPRSRSRSRLPATPPRDRYA